MAAVAGTELLCRPLERSVRALNGPAQAAVPPFSVPLHTPPVLQPVRRDATTDYYELAIREASVEILPGKLTRIWGYNAQFPGPTIHARSGRRTVVRQRNQLRVPISTHLHGSHVSPGNDGHPTDLVAPGATKDFHYPNLQGAASLWYHDHVHHFTSRNIYLGLAGLYLLHDGREARLRLPSGTFDVPLLIQDRSFTPSGALAFRDDHFNVVGNTILVNGRPQPYFQVMARKYRLRFYNASNTRNYRLRLDSGQRLVQIGSDGGLLPAPYTASEIELWPAERADTVVDFSRYPVGSSVVLKNAAADTGLVADVMRFDIVGAAPDDSVVPSRLRPMPPLPRARVTRTMLLGFEGESTNWVINGKRFDHRRIDARPRRGVAEVWRLANRTDQAHPMHLHNQQFRVLDRDGRRPPPGEAGFKDTVRVDPGETVSVLVLYQRYLGRYVFHCHSLPHEDHSMMGQLQVIP
jgi:FtsP/CotA-like multicopper oxidase with cupredoxin domain